MAPERIVRLPALPRRRPDSHKGTFGTVLVVAGSRGMAGAAALVGASALRSGAGLVRIACPTEVQPFVATFEPCYMTWPLAQDESGRLLDAENRAILSELAGSATALAVGPGLTARGAVPDLVAWLLETVTTPIVLDADGLNGLAATGRVDLVRTRPHPTIVTPHPGEFARLTGLPVSAIQADREAHAARFVADGGRLVLVLKGAGTVVADSARLYVNETGNPGMATGGSGDCLTGVIAALLAQGLDPFAAAQLGVYVHGLAGDIARDQNGEIGMIAGDIVDSLPDAFFHLGALGKDDE
jgi:NAD(P)H-hydrate epimerase